jgi:hypothetical protein
MPNDAIEREDTLVLVLGAGASFEIGMPLGSTLKHQIAEALSFSSRLDSTSRGDDRILKSFQIAGLDLRMAETAPFLKAAEQIKNGMPQAPSIDNYIDSHRSDPIIAICGKLAIVSCILAAEQKSKLWVSGNNIYNRIDFPSVENTWFNRLFYLINEGCQRDDVERRLERLKIISFNYDRSVEHFLHNSFKNYYEMSEQEATAAMNCLDIFHPYGTVGNLPWSRQPESIEYGGTAEYKTLLNLAKGIRTFSEGTDEADSNIAKIRTLLASSGRLVFLGFAFHPLNIELLFGKRMNDAHQRKSWTGKVFATTKGLSESDIEVVRSDLEYPGRFRAGASRFNDLTANEFLMHFARSMSLR